MYLPSEGRLTLGQWRNAHEDTRQPNIMSGVDDTVAPGLKELLLRMLSYLPARRPKIMEIYKYVWDITCRIGKSLYDFSAAWDGVWINFRWLLLQCMSKFGVPWRKLQNQDSYQNM